MTAEAKRTKDYEEGRVKHVQVAIETAMGSAAGDPAEGLGYIEALVRHQERAGAAFLDLNVDEIAPKLAVQTGAMAWLAETVQGMTALPLSIDSSSVDVIRAGLEAIRPAKARPMLNSASLERLEALDLARAHDCRVVVTAAGEKGMPEGAEERVANASRMVEAALERGFATRDLYIDPLVFPISVDSRYGNHCLDAIRHLRARFGSGVHITGGMSNVSLRAAGAQGAQRDVRAARSRGRRRRRHPRPGGEPARAHLRHRPRGATLAPRRGRDAGPGRALHGLHPRLAAAAAQGPGRRMTCRRLTGRHAP